MGGCGGTDFPVKMNVTPDSESREKPKKYIPAALITKVPAMAAYARYMIKKASAPTEGKFTLHPGFSEES